LNTGLDYINKLPPTDAEAEFLKCCGASRWAHEMAVARPFASADKVFAEADRVCARLTHEDWLEAFRAHPKIGEHKAATAQTKEAQEWSAKEQSGLERALTDTKTALARGNVEYERRFGYIFIVCATGKTAEEMLDILNRRLTNDEGTEIKMAAEEQRKITRLRLGKLLNQ